MRSLGTVAVVVVAAALVASPARAEEKSYTGTLTAAEEVPTPGPGGGAGTAKIDIDTAKNELCYELTWSNIENPTAGHIHEAAKGATGPVEVNFDLPKNGPKACIEAEVAHIVREPAGHYVNLHTASFPDGAVRGQLQEAAGGSPLPRTGTAPWSLLGLALALCGMGSMARAAGRRQQAQHSR